MTPDDGVDAVSVPPFVVAMLDVGMTAGKIAYTCASVSATDARDQPATAIDAYWKNINAPGTCVAPVKPLKYTAAKIASCDAGPKNDDTAASVAKDKTWPIGTDAF